MAKTKLSKFEIKFKKVWGRYETINPAYYRIACEFKPLLKQRKAITELTLHDMIYSRYLRITKSDKGRCTCVTSGIKRRWSDPMMQCGHYHLRKDFKYRFMDYNCRPQSWESNCANNGDYVRYTDFIAKKLFKGDHQKAIDMFTDPEFIVITKTQQIELVVNKRYPELRRLEKLYVRPK